MNSKSKISNMLNFLSAFMPVIGVAGFIVSTMIFQGKADGMSMFGVFMLPGEIFWLSTIVGTVLAIFSLIRHESLKWLSIGALAINGTLAIALGFSAMSTL